MAEPTGTSPETGPLNAETAVDAFENLLDDSGDFTDGAQDAPSEDEDDEKDDDAPADETPEGEESDEEGDEKDEVEEQDEDEDEEKDEQETDGADGTALFTVKVDGKDEQVTLDELRKGYSRTKVFTQRTMELAERRKALESESTTIQQERAQLAQMTAALTERLKTVEPEPDWDALQAEDPVEWSIQKTRWRDKQEERQRLQNVQAELQRRNAEQQAKQHKESLEAERALLLEKAPEWAANPEKAAKELSEIREYALSIGFTPEEADSVYDHRAVLALRDGMRLRKLLKKQAELGTPNSKVTLKKRGPKPLTPGSSRERPGRAQARTEAIDRARKTGRVDDAAKAFMNIPGLL